MGKIAIVTDSNSGITQAQAEELGVYVIPMPFYINEKMYLEGVTLTQSLFHRKSFMRSLRRMNRSPHLSQVRLISVICGTSF